ncbi:MAG: hypothetical protein KUL86_06515 [Castellaniella sp.]|nr:hypothetical protein [Castellaniella sp.]
MKAVVLACLMLSGCAGTSSYTVRPYTDSVTGQMTCCEAIVKSSRDVGAVSVHATRQSDGSLTLDFREQDVSASKPITAQSADVGAVAGAVSNTAAAVIKLTP